MLVRKGEPTRNWDMIPGILRKISRAASPVEDLKSNRSACRSLNLIDGFPYDFAVVCQTPITAYRPPEESLPMGHLNPPLTSESKMAEPIRFLIPLISSSWKNAKSNSNQKTCSLATQIPLLVFFQLNSAWVMMRRWKFKMHIKSVTHEKISVLWSGVKICPPKVQTNHTVAAKSMGSPAH